MLQTHINIFAPFTAALHSKQFRSLRVCSSSAPVRRRVATTTTPGEANLRRLTSRIVQLTRRKQLRQVNWKSNRKIIIRVVLFIF